MVSLAKKVFLSGSLTFLVAAFVFFGFFYQGGLITGFTVANPDQEGIVNFSELNSSSLIFNGTIENSTNQTPVRLFYSGGSGRRTVVEVVEETFPDFSEDESLEGGEWNLSYTYVDENQTALNEISVGDETVLEVIRSYAWRGSFTKFFQGKIKVVELENEENYSWYGSRLAIVNPENVLEKYEIRLYPESDRLQINYVDRTNRTGIMSIDEENTTSEILDSTECTIDLGVWYYTTIMRKGDVWKAQVYSLSEPTCFLEWTDDRIDASEPLIGVQSAGKGVVSRFDKVFSL